MCIEVKVYWQSSLLEQVRLSLLECANSMEVVKKILKLPDERKLRIVCLLRSWWTERNKPNHGDQCLSAEEFQRQV